MKKLLLLVTVLGLLISHVCYSQSSNKIPQEFLTCGTSEFSFKDLEYYEEKELIEGYCCCKSAEAKYIDVTLKILELQIFWAKSGKSSQSPDFQEQSRKVDEFQNKTTTAKNNQSRILRVLQKKYNYKGEPACKEYKIGDKKESPKTKK